MIRRKRSIGWTLAGLFAWSAVVASACTIPVFRYALERWEADRFQVIIYSQGALNAEQEAAVAKWEQQSVVREGPWNVEVIRYDLTGPAPKLLQVELPAEDRSFPWVEVRARTDWTQSKVRWEGSLTEATSKPLFDSKARQEIVRQILDGHSSVWLLIAAEKDAQQLNDQLQTYLAAAKQQLTLPEGIGLPGSELYSPVPLELRFSVLPISPDDPEEKPFLQFLSASAREWKPDTAYVVPVFGRCRALDVIPFDELDDSLVQEISTFICGACSCQVKQANPGFDLLVSVNWTQKLFGALIPEPAVSAGNEETGGEPRKGAAGGNAGAADGKGADPASGAMVSAKTIAYLPTQENRSGSEAAEYVEIPAGQEAEAMPESEAVSESHDSPPMTPATPRGTDPRVIYFIAIAVIIAGIAAALRWGR